jgi:hypothetical protein
MSGTELTPHDVLADLFGELDFTRLIINGDDVAAAGTAEDRLRDAGFVVIAAGAAEIERLRGVARRALAVADERAKEANELRSQVERLRSQAPAATDATPIAWLITYADGHKQYRDSEPGVMPTPDSRLTPLYDRPQRF